MSERGTCKACGAALLWVETEAGRKMPLNAEGERRFVIAAGEGMKASVRNTYTSHFATCPKADRFRRPQ